MECCILLADGHSPALGAPHADRVLVVSPGLKVRGKVGVENILCVANISSRVFSAISSPSLHILLYLFTGKRSEQLTLPGWSTCADLVKNRGVLCS